MPGPGCASGSGRTSKKLRQPPKKSPGVSAYFSHDALTCVYMRVSVMQESKIFQAAVNLSAAERAAYLDKACGTNPALALEVEGLPRAHEQPGEFRHGPPIADMATDYRPGPDRPGMRIGPYKLLQYLGEGGMGTVFLAEQSQPVRRMVALKIIKPGMDSS